eukprot:scaffold217969_cov24-Tisochrysis_lutea.AAC.4
MLGGSSPPSPSTSRLSKRQRCDRSSRHEWHALTSSRPSEAVCPERREASCRKLASLSIRRMPPGTDTGGPERSRRGPIHRRPRPCSRTNWLAWGCTSTLASSGHKAVGSG